MRVEIRLVVIVMAALGLCFLVSLPRNWAYLWRVHVVLAHYEKAAGVMGSHLDTRGLNMICSLTLVLFSVSRSRRCPSFKVFTALTDWASFLWKSAAEGEVADRYELTDKLLVIIVISVLWLFWNSSKWISAPIRLRLIINLTFFILIIDYPLRYLWLLIPLKSRQSPLVPSANLILPRSFVRRDSRPGHPWHDPRPFARWVWSQSILNVHVVLDVDGRSSLPLLVLMLLWKKMVVCDWLNHYWG